MSITAQKVDSNCLKILVNGVLGNVIHKEFREVYEKDVSKKYVIDLTNTTNIDSSGLGMLLLFKDFAGGDNADIEIINCSDHILDIFQVTCFFRLFKIPQHDKKHA